MEMADPYELRELDSRTNDKLTVTLWWVKGTMDTFVTVLDTSVEPPVEHWIDVPKGTLPHQVYQHPGRYMPEDPIAA